MTDHRLVELLTEIRDLLKTIIESRPPQSPTPCAGFGSTPLDFDSGIQMTEGLCRICRKWVAVVHTAFGARIATHPES